MKILIIACLFGLTSLAQAKQLRIQDADLTQDLDTAGGEFGKGNDCTFVVTRSAKGLRLVLTDEKHKSLSLTLPAATILKMTTREDTDGSYEHTYRTADGNLVMFTSEDDAMYRLDLQVGSQKAFCENDF